MSKFEQVARLNQVLNVLRIAGRHNGYVFGFFAHTVLASRERDPECEIVFDVDIDIWFQTQIETDAFIKAVEESFQNSESKLVFDSSCTYLQVDLSMYGTHLARFNLCVSESYPMSDFDVDYLYFQPTEDGMIPLIYQDAFSLEQLQDRIAAKEARILNPTHFHKQLEIPGYHNSILIQYIQGGWKIMFQDHECPSDILRDRKLLQEWIQSKQPVEESKIEAVEKSKIEAVEESKIEPVEESKIESGVEDSEFSSRTIKVSVYDKNKELFLSHRHKFILRVNGYGRKITVHGKLNGTDVVPLTADDQEIIQSVGLIMGEDIFSFTTKPSVSKSSTNPSEDYIQIGTLSRLIIELIQETMNRSKPGSIRMFISRHIPKLDCVVKLDPTSDHTLKTLIPKFRAYIQSLGDLSSHRLYPWVITGKNMISTSISGPKMKYRLILTVSMQDTVSYSVRICKSTRQVPDSFRDSQEMYEAIFRAGYTIPGYRSF